MFTSECKEVDARAVNGAVATAAPAAYGNARLEGGPCRELSTSLLPSAATTSSRRDECGRTAVLRFAWWMFEDTWDVQSALPSHRRPDEAVALSGRTFCWVIRYRGSFPSASPYGHSAKGKRGLGCSRRETDARPLSTCPALQTVLRRARILAHWRMSRSRFTTSS